jgi:hypothetical protein
MNDEIKKSQLFINEKTGKVDKPMIYTYLRHHYVLSRSIVVIADEEFSSFYFQNLANQITKSLLDKLAPRDYFGCIHMTKFLNDYIKLEEKEYNL